MTDNRKQKKQMCPRCYTMGRVRPNEAAPPHMCPYASEIHNDAKHKCVCCHECERECASDI